MILFVEAECLIYHAQSLKQKRSVVKKIVTRLQNEYNVSVSELDYQDLWQRTLVGIVTVSSDRVQAERVIEHALKKMDSFPEIERGRTNKEWL
ncbi:DUF503 family protein [Aquibacillus sp. 3ASR75-11]|uniref:DUF503 family protein n=1 Tax=Terrihalobacillus insolitus TaxID=2950438 RepID=A0A9X3WQR8_9BACI|nr:DUF503 family protein [Terrihalobacillus insolitus]MDC3414099.1 DUF503 family protein [Terrihalobacillus insolitus]MDC3423540.1 DUF503 family protein [Terrihalobacillus insolitus]